MTETAGRAIAIVGVGAILPDAPNATVYWQNLVDGRYSISEVDPERWDPALYHDEDRLAADKTYSTIGGWVREWDWSPLEWRLPIPPKVGDAMDRTQKWSIAAVREALGDYGYPERPLDTDRTAVVLGNAMGGDLHYMTALRAFFPEYADELGQAPTFASLDAATRAAISSEFLDGIRRRFPEITEDSMPGELANIIAGRVANLFDFHGPNFVVDAACASAMAAIDAAIEGLEEGDYDAVLTGGVDANMSSSTFVKFCKIGALSASGTRPYGDGADGFVMGEGAAVFLLRRLADAERDGDRVYAVIRGVGGASDGRGKGITAPNPVGQRLAVERAWQNAGRVPDTATYVEGHGTSTKVGDVVEVDSLTAVFSDLGLPAGSVPLGSVKSNIGHLKGAAGAAGMLKAALALHHAKIPPSLGATAPNPNVDFAHSPLFVNTDLRDWEATDGQVRAAGVSAFGFGGTNFHLVLEEHIPGRLEAAGKRAQAGSAGAPATGAKAPLRGAVVVGGRDDAEVVARLGSLESDVKAGRPPASAAPDEADLRAPVRVAIDYADAGELATKAGRAAQALTTGNEGAWKLLRNQGVLVGRGDAQRTAFLYTGQGSQYVNMMAELRSTEPLVAEVFDEADRVMEPLLGRPLSAFIFVDGDDPAAVAEAGEQLRQTEITQPAVLATDLAITKLLEAYGFTPDMVMGHSLGEYGALVAAGALPFADALEAVSARGKEMAHVSMDDNGLMAAVFAPLDSIQSVIDAIDGYVVIANINSPNQAVIGGASPAVEAASAALGEAGHQVVQLPVSHAFHTEIVAPASEPLKEVLRRLDLEPPHIPVVANVDGSFYPTDPTAVPEMIEILGRQVASPVQFVTGLRTLHEAGARNFVEVGPKRALQGFVDELFADETDVVAAATNHPKTGDIASFNQALCALWAAGLGVGSQPSRTAVSTPAAPEATATAASSTSAGVSAPEADLYEDLGHLFHDFLRRSRRLYQEGSAAEDVTESEPVVVTGAALGLPGTERVFDDHNIGRLLDGESFIDTIPVGQRRAIVDRHITRLVKSESGGGAFETIDSPDEVLKLAGRKGAFDFSEEFGYPADRLGALDMTSQLAMAAGIDALRDAGIPLVMNYKTTTTGSKLPERWGLPPALRDRTGVIFASAFPGVDRLVDEVTRFELDHGRRQRVAALEHLIDRTDEGNPIRPEIEHMLHEAQTEIAEEPYEYDRRFLFKVLSMGHSQFAELIGARGPNTQINSACASTTQGFALAEDWIRLGRCDRAIVIAADDVTSDGLLSWIGAGFLATGAAATDDVVEEAALPFDRRRHGMIVGMGAAAAVVESARSARERSLRPICEVLSTDTANSAFHGTRLDITHIRAVMEDLVSQAERRWGVDRREMAGETVFVSHETYTPARGGSAQAEVDALRHVFGDAADSIVVANTKGFTGHAMGAGIEDVLAVKSLETGMVPPIANVKEVDPDLGHLNLSKGGAYPVRYALRLGAGFGSQISMSLLRWVPSPDGVRPEPDELGFDQRIMDADAWKLWLRTVSGHDDAEIEVVARTLRVVDVGPPAVPPAPAARRAAPAPAPASSLTAPPSAEAPVAPPAPEPAAVAAAPTPGASDADAVVAAVLAVVAEQTGYPSEMLDLELDLEADLGIDTVKQAETFAAIRERYGIERDESLSLRDYPTLGSVVEFVRERAPGGAAAPSTEMPAVDAVPEQDEPAPDLLAGDDEQSAAVPRRVVTSVPRPDLALCAPTGVALGDDSRVIVVQDEGGVGAALVGRLEKVGVDVLGVDATADADALLAAVDGWKAGGPVHGVYWLAALDEASPVAELDLDAWHDALAMRVKGLYRLLRYLYEDLDRPGTFVLAGTRLGGRHGYDDDGAVDPLGGGVVGVVKSFHRERPDVLAKAVDFPSSPKTAALADALIAETERDPGIVEVGILEDRRFGVGTVETPVSEPAAGLTLDADSVFVVTGAAGSIVSAIVADLARASHGTFHLLDLVPAPDRDDPDLAAFGDDKEGLKRTIFERLKAAGEKATPVMVERRLAAIERAHAALSAIRAVEQSGGTVHYHSVNLLDAEGMAEVMADVLEKSGTVDVLLHAGGIEISKALPDKEPSEFDLVFGIKSDGWFHLMQGLRDVPLGATVAFSSVAGRYGNAGQSDYSGANDLLCKLTSNLRTARPDTLGLVLDWTAWGDIGMATRGSIPTVMKAAGIDMLPAAAGIPMIRRELTAETTTREQVVGLRLGVLTEEPAPAGGLDQEALVSPTRTDSLLRPTAVRIDPSAGLTVTFDLDPGAEPFLDHHRIDGTAVLPGVMGIEAFATTARLAFPTMHVASIDDVEFTAPCKFFRDEPRTLRVVARFAATADEVVAHCELIGERLLANQERPQVTVHFVGRVRLVEDPPPVDEVVAPDGPGDDVLAVGAEDIYRIYFHGPAYQVMERAWRVGDDVVGAMAADLPAEGADADASSTITPRLVELCFQTAGVWEIGTTGAMSLPAGIRRTSIGTGAAEGPVRAVVRPLGDGEFDALAVDGGGRVLLRLQGYRTIVLPGSLDQDVTEPLRTAMADEGE